MLSPLERKKFLTGGFAVFVVIFISFIFFCKYLKSHKIWEKKRDIIRDLLRLNDMIDEMILFFHDFSELFGVRMSRKMQ